MSGMVIKRGAELYWLIPRSSAKDNLTGQNVAVKKIMKPFSTPVLSKRTYRELKLLKHLKHENVSFTILVAYGICPADNYPGHFAQRYLYFSSWGYVRHNLLLFMVWSNNWYSYFVTELLGTDLHRLLTSRPLEKQFIQYFLYQILVSNFQSQRILQ